MTQIAGCSRHRHDTGYFLLPSRNNKNLAIQSSKSRDSLIVRPERCTLYGNFIEISSLYHYDNGTRSSRIVSHTHTHTHVQNTGLTYLADCVLTRSIDNMCMRRRTGEGLIKLVSALTWSTDDMRMRKGTGAGLIHAHLAGVGLVA